MYYPFHTRRLEQQGPENINGSSWLGKNVIAKQDGTYIFNNKWDTIVIKTMSSTGDSWIFYNDNTSDYYIATVIAQDTMTVVNVFDSVKIISYEWYKHHFKQA